MSRHKTYSLSPRDCLKTCLFQKWQRMVAPPGESHTACCAAWESGTACSGPALGAGFSQPQSCSCFMRLGVMNQAFGFFLCWSAFPEGQSRAADSQCSLPGGCQLLVESKAGMEVFLPPHLSSGLGGQQSCGGEEGGDTAWRGNVVLEEVGFA